MLQYASTYRMRTNEITRKITAPARKASIITRQRLDRACTSARTKLSWTPGSFHSTSCSWMVSQMHKEIKWRNVNGGDMPRQLNDRSWLHVSDPATLLRTIVFNHRIGHIFAHTTKTIKYRCCVDRQHNSQLCSGHTYSISVLADIPLISRNLLEDAIMHCFKLLFYF